MATVLELLRAAADSKPDRTAISFPGAAGTQLTNAGWYGRARQIAPELRRNSRVLVLLPTGPDFFAAILAAFHAGACAVPIPPPANNSDRFVNVAMDAEADAIITTEAVAATARRIWTDSGAPPIRWIITGEPRHEATADEPVAVAPDSLAVLQYTSGSTGKPKGVAISHEVLTAWLDGFVDRVALPAGSTVVTWAPVHHALGLTVALMALPMGGQSTLLAPEDVLADPLCWLRTISATPTPVFSGAPPFGYQLCVDAVAPPDRDGLDLSRWEVALIGSERIRPRILDRFTEQFGPHGFAMSAFFPSYGMTEIMMAAGHRGPAEPVRLTVDAAALERGEVRPGGDAGRAVELVASGPPCTGLDLVVVDPETRTRRPDGQVGELWVRGPVVSCGYWRRPELTAETFGQYLEDGAGPYLRTGDLCFFHQGELVVCGRLSELIIIRGRNLLPQDIEATVQGADPVLGGKAAAAFSVEGDDTDHLVIVVAADPDATTDPDHIAEKVRRAVTAAHEVEAHAVLLVPSEEIPQTGTGKVQRAACRLAYQNNSLTPFGAARARSAEPVTQDAALSGLIAALPAHLRQTVAEAELRRWIGALAGLPVDTVATDCPLIELGLDSLKMMKLRGMLDTGACLDKRLTDLASSTVAELARDLAAALPARPQPVVPAGPAVVDENRFEPFRLTDVQHAYLMGSSGDYPLSGVNTHYYAEFDCGELNVGRLHEALRALVRRHDMLRAVASLDGTQRVLPEVPDMPMPLSDLRAADAEHVAAHLERIRTELSHQTFPAGSWPLLDVRVTLLPGGRSRVHISLDLLIADLWSLRILSADWRACYGQPDIRLPPLGTSFRQYVCAHDPSGSAAARDYWLSRLDSLPPGPELPLRCLPEAGDVPRFHRRAARLDGSRWDTLRARAGERGLTAVSVLLAAYASVLGAWSRRSRFTLNLPTFHRKPVHADVEEVIGDFTSVTLLEVDLAGAADVTELAVRLRDQLWRDLEHQDFDGVRVLRELARHRGVSAELFAPTVFAAAVGQTGGGAPELPLSWLGEQVYALSQTPQVLLDHQILEGAEGLVYNWDSVDSFFQEGVLDEMFAAYQALLDKLTDEDDGGWTQPLTAHPPLPAVEANHTAGPCPEGLLHQRILVQAERRPDAPAVIGADETLTFAGLRDRACVLAQRLRRLGAGHGQLVAVSMPKGAGQIVAVLAVHLAGAAYLPIDPVLPVARQDQLLAQGQCRIVLAGNGRSDWPDGVTLVRAAVDPPPHAPIEPPELVASPDDLAYVIFTSGSTGDPKGVAVSHRAALNTCIDINDRFEVGVDDRVLGLSSLSFDLSVYDIFGVLGAGGALVLPPPGSGRDPQCWLDLIHEHRVTIWNSVPALMAMLTEYTAADTQEDQDTVPLRLTLLSGDWVPVGLPDRIRALAPGCRVVSLGGATEAAIWSICYEIDAVDPAWESIPYGRPMRNQRFHVLNDLWQECPAHVTGELFIAGAGLAEGYFGDPQRTTERFVVHPRTGERLYRTGDLGRWRPDGTIEFLGREDFQVKIGGYRIELGEIENALTSAPGVRSAVVTAPGDRGHRRLVAYLVPDTPVGTDALVKAVTEHISDRLPAYMIPASLQVIDALPLSGNGKVDRSALPDPVADAPSAGAAPDMLVDDLRARIGRLVRADAARLPVDAALPSIGIDSLRAIELRTELKRDHGVVLPIRTLLSGSLTIGALARSVGTVLEGNGAVEDGRDLPRVQPDPALRYEPFDLTDLQHAYLVGRSGDYPLGGVGSHFYVEFDSTSLRADRLHQALTRLVERHDMLRAVISAKGTQRVLDTSPLVPLPVYDLRKSTAEEVGEHLEAIRGEMAPHTFALDAWPLFDVRVSRLPDGTSRVHFGMDLLIADVWSIGILLREWEALYHSDETALSVQTLTFRDYLTAAKSIPDTPAARRAEAYWAARIDTLPPGPDLPLRATPGALGHPPAFERLGVRLSAPEWSAVKAQAAQRDLTPNAVLLACYAAVLGRWSRRQCFTLNLPVFNRHPLHERVNDIVGDFTSVTLLEVDLTGSDGLAALARRVHAQLGADLEHREFGGVEVLRRVAQRADVPEVFAPVVFTSALGQDRHGGGDLALDWLGEQVFGISQTPQVLLDNQVYELAGELVVHWDAVAELFPEGVLNGMFAAYCGLLRNLALGWWDQPRLPGSQAEMIAATVRAHGSLPAGLLHERFLKQVETRPDATAVIAEDATLTFGELLARARTVAHRLSELERAGEPVAVSLPKGARQVASVLGVLLAGSPYVPIAPELPAAQRERMLAKAGCDTVLCAGDSWPAGVRIIVLDGQVDDVPVLASPAAPSDPAYIAFTSDSAAVVVSHRAALNTCVEVSELAGVGPGDRVFGLSPLGTDLSVYDVFGVLGAGGTLVLPGPGDAVEPHRWIELIREYRVTVWNSVPEPAAQLAEHCETKRVSLPLHLALLSGGPIPVTLPERLRSLAPGVRIVSLSGATEAAMWSLVAEIDRIGPDWQRVPPGAALPNHRVHVLNDRLQECPVHTVGELFLGGAGLADGYCGDPERTAARFVVHPGTGERLFRTGHLARRRPDGTVEPLDPDPGRDGGIDRSRPTDAQELDGAQTDVAERLRAQIAELLRADPADVAMGVALPALGLDSLRAIQLRNRVQRELGVTLSMRTLLSNAVTVAELAVATSAELDGATQPLPVVRPQPHLAHQPFELTDLQQAYVIGRSSGLEMGGVSTYFYAECVGRHDPDRLAAAFQSVVDRHDMLRATVTPDGEQQVLANPPPVPVRRYDLRGADATAIDAHLDQVRAEMAQQIIPLGAWPLFDLRLTILDRGVVHVHFGCDMLIADVWSIGLLLREWVAFYRGDDLGPSPLTLTFRDYLAAARTMREGSRALRARRYWQDRLDTLPAAPKLPTQATAGPPVFERHDLRLEPRQWEALKQRAAAGGLTPNAVLVSALAAVVGPWSRASRFLMNLPTFNRAPLHDDVDAIIGDFTSVTLLEVDLGGAETIADLAERVHTRLVEDLDHHEYSGIQVLRDLFHRRGTSQLAPVVFTSALGQGGDEHGDLPTGWLGTQVYGRSQTPQVVLDNQVYEVDSALVVHWDFVAGMFPPGVIDAMFAQYEELLQRISGQDGLEATIDGTPAVDIEPAERTLPERLGEIECALTAHPGIREAVVTAPDDRGIVAHVVPAMPGQRPAEGTAVDSDLFTPEDRTLILFDETERVEFKVARKGLRQDLTAEPVVLPASGDQPCSRSSRRRYADRPVNLDDLAALLETLRSQETGALAKYRYASAGNSYAVQTYLHVVDGKVGGLPGGTYYHDPAGHRLVPVVPGAVLTSAVRLGADQQALDTAAFTVFLVAALDAVEPLYGRSTARDVCLIEAGLIAQLLEDATVDHGIGLCQLRVVDGMQEIRDALRLGERHEVIHALLGGALLGADEEPAPPAPATPRDQEAVVETIRTHLAAQLPQELLPARYALLDALPRTAAGDVDRAALAEPGADGTPPEGDVETRIAEVIKAVLGAQDIGRDRRFFDLGADSVLLVRAHRRLQSALDRRFPLTHMFEYATVRKLAEALTAQRDGGTDEVLAEAARRGALARRARRAVPTFAGTTAQEGQA